MYEFMTPEERAEFKEAIRLFRHPSHAKKTGLFHNAEGKSSDSHPYTSYKEAFKKYVSENYETFLSRSQNDNKKPISTKKHVKNTSSSSPSASPENGTSGNESDKKQTNSFSRDSSPSENSPFPDRRTSYDKQFEEMTFRGIDRTSRKLPDDKENVAKDKGFSPDDIIAAIQTPNPSTQYFTRRGVGADRQDELDKAIAKEIRRVEAEYGGDRHGLHSHDPSMSEYIKEMYTAESDPLIVNKNTNKQGQAENSSSYFSQWKQNIAEEQENQPSRRIREGNTLSRGILSVIFVFLLVIVAPALVSSQDNPDIPITSKSDRIKPSSERDSEK